MGIFNVFWIVQMVRNRGKHHNGNIPQESIMAAIRMLIKMLLPAIFIFLKYFVIALVTVSPKSKCIRALCSILFFTKFAF